MGHRQRGGQAGELLAEADQFCLTRVLIIRNLGLIGLVEMFVIPIWLLHRAVPEAEILQQERILLIQGQFQDIRD